MVEISFKNDEEKLRDMVLDIIKDQIEKSLSQNKEEMLKWKALEIIPNWQSIIKDEIDRIRKNLLSAI